MQRVSFSKILLLYSPNLFRQAGCPLFSVEILSASEYFKAKYVMASKVNLDATHAGDRIHKVYSFGNSTCKIYISSDTRTLVFKLGDGANDGFSCAFINYWFYFTYDLIIGTEADVSQMTEITPSE